MNPIWVRAVFGDGKFSYFDLSIILGERLAPSSDPQQDI
jgi:hypothetical protein